MSQSRIQTAQQLQMSCNPENAISFAQGQEQKRVLAHEVMQQANGDALLASPAETLPYGTSEDTPKHTLTQYNLTAHVPLPLGLCAAAAAEPRSSL